MEKGSIQKVFTKDKSSRLLILHEIHTNGWETVLDEMHACIDFLDREEIEEALFEYLKI